MDQVIHFEIPVTNLERGKTFYSKVFGWKIKNVPDMDYNIVHTVELDKKMMLKEKGVINGGMMKKSSIIKNPVVTINVKDIDKTISIIKNTEGNY